MTRRLNPIGFITSKTSNGNPQIIQRAQIIFAQVFFLKKSKATMQIKIGNIQIWKQAKQFEKAKVFKQIDCEPHNNLTRL